MQEMVAEHSSIFAFTHLWCYMTQEGLGMGERGEEDVVSVTKEYSTGIECSWLKNIVQVLVQETPSWSWFSKWRALWVVVCIARLLVSAPLTELITPLPWRVLQKICVCKRWNILTLQNEDCSSRWNKQLLKSKGFSSKWSNTFLLCYTDFAVELGEHTCWWPFLAEIAVTGLHLHLVPT